MNVNVISKNTVKFNDIENYVDEIKKPECYIGIHTICKKSLTSIVIAYLEDGRIKTNLISLLPVGAPETDFYCQYIAEGKIEFIAGDIDSIIMSDKIQKIADFFDIKAIVMEDFCDEFNLERLGFNVIKIKRNFSLDTACKELYWLHITGQIDIDDFLQWQVFNSNFETGKGRNIKPDRGVLYGGTNALIYVLSQLIKSKD